MNKDIGFVVYARVADCPWVELAARSVHSAKHHASRMFGWLNVDIEIGGYDPDVGRVEPFMVKRPRERWIVVEAL